MRQRRKTSRPAVNHRAARTPTKRTGSKVAHISTSLEVSPEFVRLADLVLSTDQPVGGVVRGVDILAVPFPQAIAMVARGIEVPDHPLTLVRDDGRAVSFFRVGPDVVTDER